MKFITDLRTRFPRLFPALCTVVALGGVGSYAAYEHLSDDCCELGAPCCHPGAACCLRHHAAKK
ncbi:MAG TPA: hypothetical protein VER12_20435 [Polyangiaceae bacterium]|nr:hypothetical protein [Polyangiaceae bacterium]HYQ30563.1 hypothetical protein [Polyangiaceae bacterium]